MSDSADEPNVDEDLRRRFEAAWIQGQPKAVEDCLPARDDPAFLPTLEELVHIDLEFGWKRWSLHRSRRATTQEATPEATVNEPPRVESYLERFPQLNQDDILVRLLEQEYLVRNQHGDHAEKEDYKRRFPRLSDEADQFVSLSGLGQHDGGAAKMDAAAKDVAEKDLPDQASAEIDAPHASSPASGSARRANQLGNYELLTEIGRGGMGVVYQARQLSADRIVALKVIRPENALNPRSREHRESLLERFRTEARAAAQLEHENIVTVYDVGEENGQHFFSMRYVEGRSLADLLREGPLPNRRAAAYVEQATRGVQVAHEHGILHRDIKPQNILVAATSDHALVADFGLAKLLEGTDELTRAGEMMGTPAYMSTEQAQDAARVGPASDVYALGATLYHLVTGRPPFQAATPLETIRQVIADEPVAPSRLNRAVDRDLETICLKCLEKDPSRRYVAAAALADDLARYLAGQPIVARPLGRMQRVARWCGRNPMLATSLALAVMFLFAALAATSIGYATTTAALEQSERRYSQARQVVNEFFVDVSDNVLLNQPGLQTLRKSLLRRVLPHYQLFLVERADDPRLRRELAKAHFRVGLILLEIESAEAALPSLHQARAMQAELVASDSHEVDGLYELAATWNAIGEAESNRGEKDQAISAFDQARQLRSRLVALEQRPEFRRVLANAEMNLGLSLKAKQQFEDASQHLAEAQRLRAELLEDDLGHPGSPFQLQILRDFAMGEYNRANLARSLRDNRAVAVPVANAIQRFEELKQAQPQDLEAQNRLAVSYLLLSSLKMLDRDLEAAVAPLANARAIADRLVDLNPGVNEFQVVAAAVYLDTGSLHQARGNSAEALASLDKARALFESLSKKEPLPRTRRNLIRALCGMAEIQIEQEQWAPARESLDNARRAVGSDQVEARALFGREAAEIEQLERRIDP